MPRVKIIVSGKVQGVCYRAFTAEQAEKLGINGTVRNLSDGNVEIIAQAAQTLLDQLVETCRQGPPAARVKAIDITALPEVGAVMGFQIIR